LLGASLVVTLALGCGSGKSGPTGVSVTTTTTFLTQVNSKLDLLFVIDDSAGTNVIQQKFYDQIPNFMSVLESLPNPPDLHVAVISTDMGAPGDATSSIGCTAHGDDGAFKSAPTGTCTDTGIQNGATYLSIGNGAQNFTGSLGSALQCISFLSQKGCGFVQPLAALDRALGADGSGVPSANADFLRDDAYLGIVLLADQDDCSAPFNTQIYSLLTGGSNQQNIANALGPVSTYRCNRYGHLCVDSSGNQIMPPLNPPAGTQAPAGVPMLDLTTCESNDTGTGLLTPVSQFVNDIKALKVDADNQILVSAIVGPPTPYAVAWLPEQNGQNTQAGELWPQIEHSCGAAGGDDVNPAATQHPTDYSTGDPGVRLAQFVNGFQNSVLASVCDASYASSMQAIATKVGALPSPPCLTWNVQQNAHGLPNCTATAQIEQNGVYHDMVYENCGATGNAPPCWSFSAGGPTCAGLNFHVVETTPSYAVTVTCALCAPGLSAPGC
jgi:hypothetical protein